MLRALLELMGVDYPQWLALSRTALKLDLRLAAMGVAASSSEHPSSLRIWFARLWVYVFIGGMLGGLVWVNKDVFFTGTLVLAYSMVMTAMLVLVDFGAVVISPDDFALLGYQPITSRTYFVARLTNVLAYTTLLALALGLIPDAVYFFTLGFRPVLGLAAFLASVLSAAAVAFSLVFIYAGILRVIHPRKLRRWVGYIQLILSFFIYGGYMFVPRFVETGAITTFVLKKTAWLFLLPPAWFASYLDLAAGKTGLSEIVPALFSVAVLLCLLSGARGKLALEYSDHLSSAMSAGEGVGKEIAPSRGSSRIFRGREARAVALLVRNQFKYDQKFRLAVLSILPMTVLYLFIGLHGGQLQDPFVAGSSGVGDAWLLYFAALMFPIMLKSTLTYSDTYQASWIYWATPADRAQLVLWSKNCVLFYFQLPYLAGIAAVCLYFFRNLGHVLVHVAVLALLSHLLLQVSVLLQPSLPFSQPPRKGQRTGGILVILMFGPMLAMLLIFVISRLVYPRPPLVLAALITLAAATWAMERVLTRWIRVRSAVLEYRD
jgi:hypothetical protein